PHLRVYTSPAARPRPWRSHVRRSRSYNSDYTLRRACADLPPQSAVLSDSALGTSGGLVPIEQAEVGRTGHQSSRVIFGGAALGQVSQRAADETLDLLLSHGVNHLDVASSYGEAEERIRPWLQRDPGRFFLATKGDKRTAAGAREELHQSLDRMGVDHVDLWQLHALADPIEEDIAPSPGGAL